MRESHSQTTDLGSQEKESQIPQPINDIFLKHHEDRLLQSEEEKQERERTASYADASAHLSDSRT
jgi:hypothetical protein